MENFLMATQQTEKKFLTNSGQIKKNNCIITGIKLTLFSAKTFSFSFFLLFKTHDMALSSSSSLSAVPKLFTFLFQTEKRSSL